MRSLPSINAAVFTDLSRARSRRGLNSQREFRQTGRVAPLVTVAVSAICVKSYDHARLPSSRLCPHDPASRRRSRAVRGRSRGVACPTLRREPVSEEADRLVRFATATASSRRRFSAVFITSTGSNHEPRDYLRTTGTWRSWPVRTSSSSCPWAATCRVTSASNAPAARVSQQIVSASTQLR